MTIIQSLNSWKKPAFPSRTGYTAVAVCSVNNRVPPMIQTTNPRGYTSAVDKRSISGSPAGADTASASRIREEKGGWIYEVHTGFGDTQFLKDAVYLKNIKQTGALVFTDHHFLDIWPSEKVE